MKVTIDRENCISCEVCWIDCPEFFEENPEDGWSQVIKAYRVDTDPAEGVAPEALADCVLEAARSCPVEIIHVEE